MLERTHSTSAHLHADQIFYRLIDGVVDSYHPILDRLSDMIEADRNVLARPIALSPSATQLLVGAKVAERHRCAGERAAVCVVGGTGQ